MAHFKNIVKGRSGGRLSWTQRLDIAVHIAEALHFLHSTFKTPIYHRDVKSANNLLDEDLNAKVADFGISKWAPIKATHVSTIAVRGTMGYIDPQYFACCQLTEKSDVRVWLWCGSTRAYIRQTPDRLCQKWCEDASLVIFAKPEIEKGDLNELIDPALRETYTDPGGHGRDSILNVGRLALKCLNMQSKARPNMSDVGRELENLRFALGSKSECVGSVDEDGSDVD